MKKYKFLLLVSCVLLAVGGVFAFRNVPETSPVTVTSYHYKLNTYSLAALQNISNWEVADPACGVEGDIPCVIRFDGNSSQFDAYLDGFSSVDAITDVADERKASQ